MKSILELDAGNENHVIVNCKANQIIEIDKLYGPLSALGVRIRLEYTNDKSDWVVEREKPIPDNDGKWCDVEWVETARWDCQLDWPKNKGGGNG